MKFSTFDQGLSSELANREFARRSMAILASRSGRLASGPFWDAYHRLEECNAPRFRAAAERMRIPVKSYRLARARGWLTGHTPAALLPELLRFAFPRTIEYAEDLRRLSKAGPTNEREFLDYMVRQEDLQVQMMHAALVKDYKRITALVEDFIAKEG